MLSCPQSPRCLKDLRGSVTCMKSLGLDAVGGVVGTQASSPAPRAVFFLLHQPAPGRKTASGKEVWQWKGRNDCRGGQGELEPRG